MTVVLDASAGIEVVLKREKVAMFAGKLEKASLVLSSDLYKAEVANALWKYQAAGFLSREQAKVLLGLALALVDDYWDISENNLEALTEAGRLKHPVYDLLYLTLARRTGSILLTVDTKLAKLAVAEGLEVISP